MKINNGRLSIAQRSRLLCPVLVGNLDILMVPDDEAVQNAAWNLINDLLLKDKTSVVNSIKTKTRLRPMLAAQYCLGVTVGDKS